MIILSGYLIVKSMLISDWGGGEFLTLIGGYVIEDILTYGIL